MKKVLIIFDSTFGNTERLAREIAAGIEDAGTAECKVVGIKTVEDEDISSFDGVLFGGPIHIFRATRGIRGTVKHAAKKGLDGKLVSTFDTYQARGHEGRAAKQIEEMISKKARGVKMISPGLSALVDSREGPLNAAEPAKAREFGQRFAQELTS
ncbi:MAG: hypothetical protein KAU89_06500 [Candidatus Thorarchaeota archaeon]|nr:hypothetical protein [Candidatus Thorarchaeota archaeon]